MVNEIMRLAKLDAREADALHTLMHCEDEAACERCNPAPKGWAMVDGGQLPPPPDSIILPHNGYADAEQAAHYAPNEPTHEQTPASVQTDGPRSCENYWNSCECVKCEARDYWYSTAAT